MPIQIDEDRCLGCGCCIGACDYGALEFAKISKSYETAISNSTECESCQSCVDLCANSALSLL